VTDPAGSHAYLSLARATALRLSQETDAGRYDYEACAYHCEQALRVAGLEPASDPRINPKAPAELHKALSSFLSIARNLLGSTAEHSLDAAHNAADGAWRRLQSEQCARVAS